MNSIGLAVLVGIGGSIGALLRYGIGRMVVNKHKPSFYGTLLVNLAGSFVLGLFIGIGLEQQYAEIYACAGIGLLGGLTTFSTLNVQKVNLHQSGSRSTLAYYIAATYIGGLSLTAIGVGLGYLIHT